MKNITYCVTVQIEVVVAETTPDVLLGWAIRRELDQALTAQVAVEWAGSDGVAPLSENIAVPASA